MKAQELRIGNWVNENTKISRSKSLTENLQKELHQITATDLVGIENGFQDWFNPIPLTEEWLLKFGFVKINESDYLSPHSCYCFDIKRMGMMVEDARQNGEWHFCDNADLDYVHQLQNLYFALTGSELTIKQTTDAKV